MKEIAIIIILLFVLRSHAEVPTVESLGMEWKVAPLRQMPVVQNFRGAATLRNDVKPGFGICSLGPLTMVPWLGNFQNSTFKVDNEFVELDYTGWYGCKAYRNGTAMNKKINVLNTVTVDFEDVVIVQQWNITHYNDEEEHTVYFNMDGPFFRSCDQKGNPHSYLCGWGLHLPIDRRNFALSSQLMFGNIIMLVRDNLTDAIVASGLGVSNGTYKIIQNPNNTFTAEIKYKTPNLIVTWVAVPGTGDNFTTVKSQLLGRLRSRVSGGDQDGCEGYNKRFQSAFDPNDKFFPDNLPTLESNSAEIDHLYYWSAHALLSLMRVDYPTYPRQYVISEGPSNSYDGSQGMGGAGQFLWDISFASISYTLLDKDFTKFFITYVIQNSDIAAKPIKVPQVWDSFIMNPNPGGYRFDTYSAYFLITHYITLTNDTDFLTHPLKNKVRPDLEITVVDYLRKLSWQWKDYPASDVSEYLVNYGDDKRLYLEAVPTYHSVVPALQLCNAGMLLNLARLLEIGSGLLNLTDKNEISYLRGNATEIIKASMKFQYVFDEKELGGYWKCIYYGGKAVGVRSIADFMYSGLAISVSGRSSFPEEIRKQSAKFFLREILADGWVRALSLSDPVMSEVYSLNPSTEAKVSMRADWTGTGGYGGLAGFAADAYADLSQDLDQYVKVLTNISLVSYSTMPAQGVAVMTPPYIAKFMNNNNGIDIPVGPYGPAWPEFFDESGFPAFWPNTARSIQNAEGSIVDSIIRTLFGWRPDFLIGNNCTRDAAIKGSLYRREVPRGSFEGKLRNLKTPYGLIDLTLNSTGLHWETSRLN